MRSCIAALLVIGGLALGREAISLRLVAVGALVVMIFWPEAVVGPSFQMSFAAVIAIIALYEYPPARRLFERREEKWPKRAARQIIALLATGLAVELVLAPISIYHFHRAGLLGALANMIAIPLTSFVIMPAEALALILDAVGLGYPAWFVTQFALELLLRLAHAVSALPFATIPLPTVGGAAFALAMFGFLWLMLWRERVRWLGLAPLAMGFGAIAFASPPDLLVTRDGRHVALRLDDGRVGLLRDRAGDYVRDTITENLGMEGELESLESVPGARCNRDACLVEHRRTGQPTVHILATRSSAYLDWAMFIRSCAAADIVISDRHLPRACQPRWLRLDRASLAQTGGIAIRFSDRKTISSHDPRDRHPWIARPPQRPRFSEKATHPAQ